MKKIVHYKNNNLLVHITLLTALLLTLSILIWVLIHCSYGFDLTDESFYLNWLANPWIYNGSISQFGYIYHPLHLLLHGDISLLRQSNSLLMFGLSCWLFFLIFKDLYTKKIALTLAIIFATSAFLYLATFHWLTTPSYNSLTLQALILSGIGILMADKGTSATSILGWVIIGIAGWLCFMAKPSSAAGLFVVTGLYLLAARKLNLRLALISLCTVLALFLLSAWTIDSSISLFIERYLIGFKNMQIMNLGVPLFRMEQFPLGKTEQHIFMAIIFALCSSTFLIRSNVKIIRTLGLGCIFICLLTGFWIIFNPSKIQINLHDFLVLQTLSILVASIIISCLILGRNNLYKIHPHYWLLSLYFIILPFILAFGTSNSYWVQSQLAAVFWVLAGLIILLPALKINNDWNLLLPIAVATQLITIVSLQIAMEYPYRQAQSLYNYDNKIFVGSSNSELKVPKEFAQFITDTTNTVAKILFKPYTPVIDLTGQSPGILYIINAKPVGQAWILGGYAGSDRLAIASLQGVSCKELAHSWILIEPTNKISISTNILNFFGININTDYNLAAEYIIPIGVAGSNAENTRKQQLLKPNRPMQQAINACEKMESNLI